MAEGAGADQFISMAGNGIAMIKGGDAAAGGGQRPRSWWVFRRSRKHRPGRMRKPGETGAHCVFIWLNEYLPGV